MERSLVRVIFLAVILLGCLSHGKLLAGSKSVTERPSAEAPHDVTIGQIIRDCSECPELVAVPQLGHTARNPGTIFYASRFEVTWKQYLMAVRAGACPVPMKDYHEPFKVDNPKINDDYPLTALSPDTFSCYLEWLSKKTGKAYRIPSADEWEHIARAGTSTTYYWGDDLGYNNAIVFDYFDAKALQSRLGDNPQVGYRDDPRSDVNWKRVYPVGQFKPNPWGLYDMIGNAAEVTTEPYPPFPACVKHQPARVCARLSVRGNKIGRLANTVNPRPPITESLVTARYWTPQFGGKYLVGFRLVRD